MIGEVKFNFGRRRVTAVLTDELTWHCDEQSVEEYLNAMVPSSPRAGAGRVGADEPAALHYLYQAGERLGGEVRPARRPRPIEIGA